MHLTKIAIGELRAPVQVSRSIIEDEGIEALAQDIRTAGLMQPLHVREVEGGYEVVAGHRRLLACRKAGLPMVPCLLLGPKDPPDLIVKVHENLHREDLSPVEEGAFFAQLLDACDQDTEKLAALVKQSRAHVEKRLNLMNGDPLVLEAVAHRQISLGVAEELNKLKLEKDRKYYLEWAIVSGATVQMVRTWGQIARAQELGQAQGPPPPPSVIPPLPGPADVLKCLLCGSMEPTYDLRLHQIHDTCLRFAEADRARAERERQSVKGDG